MSSHQLQFDLRRIQPPTWKIESLNQVQITKSQRSSLPLIDTPSLTLIRKQLSEKFSCAASSHLNNLKKKRASSTEKQFLIDPSKFNSYQFCHQQQEVTLQKSPSVDPIDPIDLDCTNLGLSDFEQVYNLIVDFSNKDSHTKYDFSKLNIRSIDLSGNEMELFFKENQIKNVQERFRKVQKLKTVLSLNLQNQKQSQEKNEDFKRVFQEINFVMPNLEELMIDIPFEQDLILDLMPNLRKINDILLERPANENTDKENQEQSQSSSQQFSKKRDCRKNRKERAKSREFQSKKTSIVSPFGRNQQLYAIDQNLVMNILDQSLSYQTNQTMQTFQKEDLSHYEVSFQQNESQLSNKLNLNQTEFTQIQELTNRDINKEDNKEMIQIYFSNVTADCMNEISPLIFPQAEVPCPSMKPEISENKESYDALEDIEQLIMATEMKTSALLIDEEVIHIIKEQDGTLSDIPEEESQIHRTFQSRNISFTQKLKTSTGIQDSSLTNESNKVFAGEIVISANSSPNSLVKQIGQGIRNKAEEIINRKKNSPWNIQQSRSRSSKYFQKQELNQESDTASNQSTPPQNKKNINFCNEIETVTKIEKKPTPVNTAASPDSTVNNSQTTNIITRPFNMSYKTDNNSSNICDLLLKNVKNKSSDPPAQITIPEKDLFTMRGILERIRVLQMKSAIASDSKKHLITKNSQKKTKDGNFDIKIDEMIKQLVYSAYQPLSTSQYRQKDLEQQMFKIFEWINDQAIGLLKQQKGPLGQKDSFELSIILSKIQEEKDRIFFRISQLIENKDEIELKRQALNELKRMNSRCQELEDQYDKYVQLVQGFQQSQHEIQQQELMINDLEMQIQDQEGMMKRQESKIKAKDTIIAEKDLQLSTIENRFIERIKNKDSEVVRNKKKTIKYEQELQRLKENEIKHQITLLEQKSLEKRIFNLEMSNKKYSDELQNMKKSVKTKEQDICGLTQLITVLKAESIDMCEEGEILYEDYHKNLNFIGKHLALIQTGGVVKRKGSLNSSSQKMIFLNKAVAIKSDPQISFNQENEIKWIKKQIQGRSMTSKRLKFFCKNHNYNSLIKSFDLEQQSVCNTSFKSNSLSITKKSNSFIGRPKESSIISRRSKDLAQTQNLPSQIGSEIANPKFRKSVLIQHYKNLLKNPDLSQIEGTSVISRKSQSIQQPVEKTIQSPENLLQNQFKPNSKYSTVLNSRRQSFYGLNQRVKSTVNSVNSEMQESGYSKIMSDRKKQMGCYYRKTSPQGSACKRCCQRAEESLQQSENLHFQSHVCSSPNKRIQYKTINRFEKLNTQEEVFSAGLNKFIVKNVQASRAESVNPSVHGKNQIHFELYSQTQNSERATETAIRDQQSVELKNYVADTAQKKITRVSSQEIQATATKCEILIMNECRKSYKSRAKSGFSVRDSLSIKTSKQQKYSKKSGRRVDESKILIQKPVILSSSSNVNQSRSSRRQRDQRNNPFRSSKNSTQLQKLGVGGNQLISPQQRPENHEFFRENSSVAFCYPCTDNEGGENLPQYPGCGPMSCPISIVDIHKSITPPSTHSLEDHSKEPQIIKSEQHIKVDENMKSEETKTVKSEATKTVKSKQTTQERQKSKLKTRVVTNTSPAKKKLKFITKKEPKSIQKKHIRSKSGLPMVKPLLTELLTKKQIRWDSLTAPTKSSKMKFQDELTKKVI